MNQPYPLVLSVLTVIILVGAGCQSNSASNTNTSATNQPVNTPDTTTTTTNTNTTVIETESTPGDVGLEGSIGDIGTEFAITWNDDVAQTITFDSDFAVTLQQTTGNYTFTGFEPDGLGGVIAFSGPQVVWRTDRRTGESEEIFNSVSKNTDELFFAAASADGQIIASVAQGIDGNEIRVRTIGTDEITKVVASLDLPELGDVVFSPDGQLIAFAAQSNSTEIGVTSAVFMADYVRGNQNEQDRSTTVVFDVVSVSNDGVVEYDTR